MRGMLSWRLEKYKFECAVSEEKEELYVRQTGNSTFLYIEGRSEPHPEFGEEFYFDFYKRTYYKNHVNQDTVYGEHLDCEQLGERVRTYFENRDRYIALKEQEKMRRKKR